MYKYVAIGQTQLEKKLCEAFDVFDNAGTGEVDVRDLGTIIRFVGCVVSEAELQEIQVELEDVENNCVPLNRFLEYMTKVITERKFKPAEPEDLLNAFQLLDSSKRGYLMKEDLEKALTEIGEPFSEDELVNMMSFACDPQTKRINYEHYINKLIVSKSFACMYLPGVETYTLHLKLINLQYVYLIVEQMKTNRVLSNN